MDWIVLSAFFLAAFSSLFTIINPISAAFFFTSITEDDEESKKILMARKASIVSAIILIIFAFGGNIILNFFGITLDAFRIAGGLLVARVGLSMTRAAHKQIKSEKERQEAIQRDDVSVIPMAIPMLSGPGAMTTVIVLMSTSTDTYSKVAVILAILVVCALAYLILAKADWIQKSIGHTGKNVVDKILGLIVMVVGVQFIINGVQGVLKLWGLI